MMHKAWSSIEEVTYCFSRSSVKFQGHTALKIVEFDPNWAFPDCNSSLNSPMAMKLCIKAWSSMEEMPYCFSRSSIKFQGHRGQKIANFHPNWAFPDSNSCFQFQFQFRNIYCHNVYIDDIQFEFNEGFEIMHKAWCNEEVPYNFSRSSIKFQGHMV